jgi:L-fucose isomerase-like protein
VHSLVKKVIADYSLDAVTVECFPMVQEKGVTACLSLSFLNDLGIPAGCEGDISSITGMMVARELYGEIPWMANLAGIKGNKLLLAHCTAPVYMLSGYNVTTHFETGKGTAVQGMFNWQGVTVFRFSNKLDRLFTAYGKTAGDGYEENACRTQLWVELPEKDIRELKTDTLGNHHLVLPGDRLRKLIILSRIL